MPPKGRLKANQKSAIATKMRRVRVEVPALEDQPRDRRRQHDHEGRRGDQQQVDLAHALPTVRRIPAGSRREARRLSVGKQHRRHRHAEDALGQHVDAKGVVDRARRFIGDEAAEGRVDQLVEVSRSPARSSRAASA